MTPIKRIQRGAGALGAAVLLAATLSACGGAPTDASAEDYCDAFIDTPKGLESDDAGEQADAAGEWADNLNEVGTPEDIDGDAREGFEIFVDFLGDVNEDDIKDLEDADSPDEVFDGDDGDKVKAFTDKTGEVCADQFGGGAE